MTLALNWENSSSFHGHDGNRLWFVVVEEVLAPFLQHQSNEAGYEQRDYHE